MTHSVRPLLYIGSRNYSSWSLRAWMVARAAALDFDEVVIDLGLPDTKAKILEASPSGRVPCLVHGDMRIWDSLAIAEYLAETVPEAALWPTDSQARSCARSISCEMHAGFPTLRKNLPMNARASLPGKGRGGEQDDLLEIEIARVEQIWTETRETFGQAHPADDGYLFGAFTIADAIYAPVVLRFSTYHVGLNPVATAYMRRMLEDRHLKAWCSSAAREAHVMPEKEL